MPVVQIGKSRHSSSKVCPAKSYVLRARPTYRAFYSRGLISMRWYICAHCTEEEVEAMRCRHLLFESVLFPLKALAQSFPDYSEINVLYLLTREQFIFLLYFQSTWNDSFSSWWFPYAASSERAVAYSVSIRPHSETITSHLTGRDPEDRRSPFLGHWDLEAVANVFHIQEEKHQQAQHLILLCASTGSGT